MKKMLALAMLLSMGMIAQAEDVQTQGTDTEKSSCCNTCNTCCKPTSCCGCKKSTDTEVKATVADTSADANCACSGKPRPKK